MKYCPNCRAEYHDDVAECHDCQVALVDDLPEESREEWESVEPVVIHTAAAVIDAELIVGTLRAHGIRAFAAGTGAEFFSDAGQIGQLTRVPGPLNAIRIMVHPDDEEDARSLLVTREEGAPDDDDYGPAKWNLDPVRSRRVLWIAAAILLVLVLFGVLGGFGTGIGS